MGNDYISSSEAAELLDVDQKTITNWVKAGHLIGFKHGPAKNSPYRILRSSVMEKLPGTEKQINK